LGNAGRFSTDLDFVAPNDDKVLEVCGAIDGAKVSGFEFSLEATRGDGRHWSLQVRHPVLGQPDVPASVEFARRPLVLKPEHLGFVPAPLHKSYSFDLPNLPIIAEAEACSEKLARYRRVSLGRDLYDLWHFAQSPLDEALVRRLWVLKVWCDVVDDNRGDKPLDTYAMLRQRNPQEFAPESIGKLTQPVDIPTWEKTVRRRFQFLAVLDEEEKLFSTCNQRYRREIEMALSAGGFAPSLG
jgi:predicted nucleotidyltransferase component of viral defense system